MAAAAAAPAAADIADGELARVTVCGQEFVISQNSLARNHGHVIWDSALALVRFLEASPKRFTADALRGRRVLDLGAGCGLVSLVLACVGGAHVVATDLPSVLPRLARNLRANASVAVASGQLRALPFDWTSPDDAAVIAALGPFDLVVGTDVVYAASLVAPLVAALRTARAPAALFANEERDPDVHKAFMAALEAAGGDTKTVPTGRLPAEVRSPTMRVVDVKFAPWDAAAAPCDAP
jgi:predicted nicotinamide N-methyase